MASSSSPSSQRRRPLKKRLPLTRSNSSFLGTIRNIVTAPLTWFSSTDDFEDSKDLKGKRRRAVAPQTAPPGERDGWSTPNKRMRVHSPPRDHQQLHHHPSGSSYGHLDPPISVFQQQHNQPNFFNQPTTTDSVSVSIPVPTMQAYEPVRNNTIIRDRTLSRTMSIDPPSRPVSRSSAMASIPSSSNSFDLSVESSATLTRHRMRDLSMPPLSTRPSFLMRASMTPQPQPPKEASEPPSLSTLVINPVFVRGPSAHEIERHQPSATLGSLVDSVRSTRSPVRQHSSLLFATSVENTNNHRRDSPAEKALHELEVYKTPLLPTRLRSNIPGSSSMIDDSTSIDLFKSRRKSSLVLMHDDERVSRLGRKLNGKRDAPIVNGTKPYAGEGGMKKLLARRRIEAEKHEHGGEPCGSGGVEEKVQARGHASHARSTLNDRSDENHMGVDSIRPFSHSLPASKDWYSTSSASSISTSASSLRVGRTKTRAHIARPIARPMKTKFSAAYEDDDSMDGTEVLRDEGEKQLEREMLDEAAKRAPAFNISETFSFAKETNILERDSTNAKEPPISSLPFSFTKTSTVHQTNDPQQARFLGSLPTPPAPVDVDSSHLLATSSSAIPVLWASCLAPAVEDRPPTSLAVEDSKFSTPAPEAGPVNEGVNERVIPNFFASSSAFTKPLEVAQPTILTFPSLPVSATPNVSSSIGFSTIPAIIAPSEDAENPLWEGESDKRDYAKQATKWNDFGGANNPPEITKTPVFGTNSPSMSAAMFASHASSDDLVSEGGVYTQKPDDAVAAGDSLFDTPTASSLPKMPQAPPSTLFGTPSTSGPSDARSSKQAAPSLFNFGEPGPSVTTSNESPKPLMGGTNETSAVNPLLSANGFSFGNSVSTDHRTSRPATTPFSFGAAPSTPPPADIKKSLPFSFKDSAASPASAPDAFSFSDDSRSVNGNTTKPFSSFGTPITIAQTDRPTTPPRHDDQEVRMEESPTRELQQSTANGKPGAFSFGVGPGPSFGDQPNAAHVSSPFAFGTSASPNPFAKDSKPSDSKPFAGFGHATPSTLFTFGQKPVENNEPPRPSSTGSFSFTSAPSSSATGPGPTFAFGGPSNNSIGSLFGQTQPSGSAPSSPSTFNQPSPFSYTAPLPTTTNPFAFGPSQPASPAGGNTSLSLPQPSTPGGFGGGTGGGFGQQPLSPFGTSVPASSGGTLFTIGAAPPASQGPRQIRKLPTRRGGAKR